MAAREARGESLGEIFTRDFLVLATVNLAMFFGFQMTNVGIPVYMAQLGAGAQVVGLSTTFMTITATAMRVFSGALLDRFGRFGMLIGGTVVMVCSIISYAIFPFVGVIMGLRLIQGLGWGAGSTASSTIAADIIPKRRFAEGMGYFAMTNAVSSAIAPAVSVELAQGAGGVYMVYVSAAVTLLALVLSLVQVGLARRDRTKGASSHEDAVPAGPGISDASGAPDAPDASGAPDAPETPAAVSGSDASPAAGSNGPGRPGAPPASGSRLEMLFERRAVVPGVLMMLVNFGFGCITTFIALHALERGVGSVSPYFVVYAVVTLLSRPLIGKLIDRYGYRMPALLSTLCTAGTMVLIGASADVFTLAASGVLGGLGIGTAMGTFQTMAVANVEPWRRGVATSTYMTAFDLGIAFGALIGGVIATMYGYEIMYYAMAAFPLAACIVSAVGVKKDAGTKA